MPAFSFLNPWAMRLVYALMSSIVSASSYMFSQEVKRISKAADNYDKVILIMLENQTTIKNQLEKIVTRLEKLENK